jgi:hypothetical protein
MSVGGYVFDFAQTASASLAYGNGAGCVPAARCAKSLRKLAFELREKNLTQGYFSKIEHSMQIIVVKRRPGVVTCKMLSIVM